MGLRRLSLDRKFKHGYAGVCSRKRQALDRLLPGDQQWKRCVGGCEFFKSDAFGGRGRVHRGFQQSLDSVWAQVQAAVDALGADKKLFICGHSLGRRWPS
ncbi:MAG: hypothetical protein IPL27_08305 [Lewinellaceae bacterium]|nr:hypothetical protein [Lewinellaceae bacterium]